MCIICCSNRLPARGYLPGGCLLVCPGGIWQTPPVDRILDTHLWKHCLSATLQRVIIANPCSKLLCMEVRQVYQLSRNQTLVFRTWIVRQHNLVWVHKLADIVTSLCSVIYALKSLVNKWKCVSVNKLLTSINTKAGIQNHQTPGTSRLSK